MDEPEAPAGASRRALLTAAIAGGAAGMTATAGGASAPSGGASGMLSLADFGIGADGSADCTAAFQRALDAAAGRTLLVPAGSYAVRTLRLPPHTSVIGEGAPFNGVARRSTRIVGTPGADILVVAPQGAPFHDGGALRGLWLEGGRDGLVLGHGGDGAGAGGVTNMVVEDCCIRNQSGASIRIPSWIERCVFRHLELLGGIGFRLDANPANGPEGNYMDKCLFEHVRLIAATNGMRCEPIRQSGGNTLINLIFNGCGEDAALFSPACTRWTCVDWNFEGNGHTALPKARATGRIAAGSRRLDMATRGFAPGQTLCIAGAGRNGQDHVTRIAALAGAGAVLLVEPAVADVVDAEVVNARFSEIRGGTAFTFIGMGAGFDGVADGIRYAVSEAMAPVFVNCQITGRPVYDPFGQASVLAGDVRLRQASREVVALRSTVTASALPQAARGSPAVQPGAPGIGLVMPLRGAGEAERTGPFGRFEVVRTDPARTALLAADADRDAVVVGRPGGRTSIGLNVAVPAGIGGVIAMSNASAPGPAPADAGILFVEGGALKFRGGQGTVTVLAPA